MGYTGFLISSILLTVPQDTIFTTIALAVEPVAVLTLTNMLLQFVFPVDAPP